MGLEKVMKVQYTFEVDAGEERTTCVFTPRWMDWADQSEDTKARLDDWEALTHEEQTRERWEAMRPSDEECDRMWSEIRERVRNEIGFESVLPIELTDLIDKIVEFGPHRVKARECDLRMASDVLRAEADVLSDRACEYELSIFCGCLRGEVAR